MKLETETVVVLGAIAVVSVAAVYLAKRTSDGLIGAAGSVGAAINPLSDQNVFYKAAGAVGDFLGGGESRPLGVRLADVTEQTGVKPWQIMTPGTAIGTGIGNAIRDAFGGSSDVTPANDLRQIDRITEREAAAQLGSSGPIYDLLGNYIGSY